MSTAVASARANATNLRRMLPDWAWAVFFLALALLYPFILDAVLADGSRARLGPDTGQGALIRRT